MLFRHMLTIQSYSILCIQSEPPLVLQRALQSEKATDVLNLLNKEQVFFSPLPVKPVTGIGERPSRHAVLYCVMAWPPYSEYAAEC